MARFKTEVQWQQGGGGGGGVLKDSLAGARLAAYGHITLSISVPSGFPRLVEGNRLIFCAE